MKFYGTIFVSNDIDQEVGYDQAIACIQNTCKFINETNKVVVEIETKKETNQLGTIINFALTWPII
jgi:hypothetical protein